MELKTIYLPVENDVNIYDAKIYEPTATKRKTTKANKVERYVFTEEELEVLLKNAFNHYYMRGFPHNGNEEEFNEFLKENIKL